MASDTVLAATIAITVVFALVAFVASPVTESTQSETTIDLRQEEDQTYDVFGPVVSNATAISVNPNQTTVRVENSETGASTTIDLDEGESVDADVGGDRVTVALDDVHGDNESSLSYTLNRTDFLDGDAPRMLTFVGTLLLIGGVLAVGKILMEIF